MAETQKEEANRKIMTRMAQESALLSGIFSPPL